MKRRYKIQRRILHLSIFFAPCADADEEKGNHFFCLSAYNMLVVIFMNSCELVTYISSIACLISQSCSKEEVAVLASAFVQLGDTLSTILAHDDLCDTKGNK